MIGRRAPGSRPVRRPGGDLEDSTAASEDAAHAAALWLLESRARTRLELQQRLERRGFESGAIERAIDRLSAVGLVDDEVFARDLASSRAERCRELAEARLAKLQGLRPEVQFRRLAAYLVRRGYPGDVVESVVSELVNANQYEESGEEKEYGQI